MTSKTAKIWISLIGIMLAFGIFVPISPVLAERSASSTIVKPATVNLTGTIKIIAVEGVCYQFAADNGKKYELMGKFPKIDGTRAEISGVPKSDLATICQVGQPLQVKTVKVIK